MLSLSPRTRVELTRAQLSMLTDGMTLRSSRIEDISCPRFVQARVTTMGHDTLPDDVEALKALVRERDRVIARSWSTSISSSSTSRC
jgi:hypothetical protein